MNNGTIWVVATNNAEYAYLHSYCAEMGDSILEPNNVKAFPVAIVLNNKTGHYEGWSNMMDRAAHYLSFNDFVASDLSKLTANPAA